MTRRRQLAILLIVLGYALLLVAPNAQSCVTGFDATICETTATTALKALGLVMVTIAAVLLALRGPSREGPGDSTR
jgi:nitrate reductase gamma subunit